MRALYAVPHRGTWIRGSLRQFAPGVLGWLAPARTSWLLYAGGARFGRGGHAAWNCRRSGARRQAAAGRPDRRGS
eukprot:15466647-Alexandrium_andersonii.AAC.1